MITMSLHHYNTVTVCFSVAGLCLHLPRFLRQLRAFSDSSNVGYHVVTLNLDLSDWTMQSRARSAGHDYSACCCSCAGLAWCEVRRGGFQLLNCVPSFWNVLMYRVTRRTHNITRVTRVTRVYTQVAHRSQPQFALQPSPLGQTVLCLQGLARCFTGCKPPGGPLQPLLVL